MARVMIVDDEDVLLEMFATLVEEMGHQPMTATNGHEALALLSSGPEPPALILSDVMMPRMNGVDFARAVKTNPHLQAVPLILMSAANRAQERQVADRFIHKPCDIDAVAALIEHYVDGH